MPKYNIAGVEVEFPFEPYDVQLLYMEKVVLALQNGQNALLESPTGAGDTSSPQSFATAHCCTTGSRASVLLLLYNLPYPIQHQF